MQEWNDQFDLLVKSRTPLILIRSREEERVEELVIESTNRSSHIRLATWDYVEGLRGILNSEGIGARQPMTVLQWLRKVDSSLPTILFAKDFHRFTEDAGIARMLKILCSEFRKTPHTIVLCAYDWVPSSDLDDSLTILDLPLPQENELKSLLSNIANASDSNLTKETLEDLTHACSGLSEMRVRQVAAKALAQRGKLSKADLEEVLEEKRQAVARSDVLEYFETAASPSDIGGLDALKVWLNQRHAAFSDEARQFGLPLPRGVLLIGPQGTGKSLTAKAIAHSWSMPLLRLDIGRLFAGLVGASEAKARETIQYAESMAPCILWIDEIDKGFGGDARSDGGTSQRVLANLLTWMAEKKSAVFVVATANGIDRMPGELLRKGRFDEIFLLDLPTLQERFKILDLHLKQRRPNIDLPIETVASRTEGFSGAELEQTVIEAMHHAFSERRELLETDLILASTQLIPLSKTAKEQLDFLKDWASSGRARPASLRIN